MRAGNSAAQVDALLKRDFRQGFDDMPGVPSTTEKVGITVPL